MLTVGEAAGMFDVWAKSGVLGDGESLSLLFVPFSFVFFRVIDTDGEQLVFGLIERTNDEMFLAKFTEASGNPRDFVWKGLLGSLET